MPNTEVIMVTAAQDRAPASEDLTARSRIRDAALLQFAQHGVKGATFRGIAEAAGVSVGLVQHHFGSKDALRQACDAYVLDVVQTNSARSTTEEAGDAGFLAAAMRVDLRVRRAVLEVFDDRLLSREVVARAHTALDLFEAAPAAEGDDDD